MQLKVLVFVCLFASFSGARGEDDQDDCPNQQDIDPCHCDRNGLTCFELKDDDHLPQVFKYKNKYNAYRSVWITSTSLKTLKKNAFAGVRISNIYIQGNQLTEIEKGAFEGTYEYVRKLSLYDNQLEVIPVEGKFSSGIYKPEGYDSCRH